jgi:flagellar basal-body rod modification protein FlgD
MGSTFASDLTKGPTMTNTVQSVASASAAAAAQAASASLADSSAASQKPAISSDFQTFLEMLTVQMKNQDPLNPVDSSDYAVQLATFSSVEQQVLTNDLLSGLWQQMANTGMTQLAGWVGMEARTSAPALFDGSPITLSPLPAKLADETWLVVRDEAGKEVQRQQIGLLGEQVEWAGVDGSGNPLPSGLYSFEVENRASGELLGTTPVETYANVIEAQMFDGTTLLVLEGGVQVLTTDVTALRRPV